MPIVNQPEAVRKLGHCFFLHQVLRAEFTFADVTGAGGAGESGGDASATTGL